MTDPLRAALDTLRLVATGETSHRYQGSCPDALDPTSRDPRCHVCTALAADPARPAYDASMPTTHSDAHSEARPEVTTLVTDTATGDQWRVPTRAVEAIVAALDAVRPGLDAEVLARAICASQERCDGTCPDFEGVDAFHRHAAEAFAAEYARLTEERP